MPLANASLLDEATAAAEAMTLMHRMNRRSKSSTLLFQTIVIRKPYRSFTRAEPLALRSLWSVLSHDTVDDALGMLVQYPGTSTCKRFE